MHKNIRDPKFLKFANGYKCMLKFDGICERGYGEPAHSNQPKHGKGAGMKAHDIYTVPACRSCHRELDQGSRFLRDEKRDAWDYAFSQYLVMLWQDGKIGRIG